VLPKTRRARPGIFRGYAHAGGDADEPSSSEIGALLPSRSRWVASKFAEPPRPPCVFFLENKGGY
jgi:hypothetical protein